MQYWNKNETDYIISNYASHTVQEISVALNRQFGSVAWKIKKLRLIKRDDAWSSIDLEYLRNNYDKEPYKNIGEKLDKTVSAIKAKCRYLGLTKVPRRTVNETYFDTWSSDMAYLLGFIMADGCVENTYRHALSIQLHEKDIEILRFVNNKVCNTNIIESLSGVNKHQIRLRVSSKHVVNQLISYGVIPRKTGSETMEYVPNEWKLDFIRGYFDGDGSVSTSSKNKSYSCYICGSCLNMIQQLHSFFGFGRIADVGKYRTDRDGRSFYTFNIERKCDLERFRSVLYSSGGFCLKRKYDKMMSIDTTYIKKRKYV